MREIKFRGKKIDTGEWVYGFLTYGPGTGTFFIDEVIYYGPTQEEPCGGSVVEKHNINPETIGQFTGLRDRNGQEIYEGDIVSEAENIGVIEWDTDYARWVYKNISGSAGLYLHQIKVIGNIHEEAQCQTK